MLNLQFVSKNIQGFLNYIVPNPDILLNVWIFQILYCIDYINLEVLIIISSAIYLNKGISFSNAPSSLNGE